MKTMTANSRIYYQDSNLLIRRYESCDEPWVHQVFEKGMFTLAPRTLQLVAASPMQWLATLVSTVLVHHGLSRLVTNGLILASSTRSNEKGAAGVGALDVPSTANATTVSCWWWLPVMASMTSVACSYLFMHKRTQWLYQEFIQSAIHDDLSNIPSVYLEGNGNFLVAVDRATGHIVGCVGAQDKRLSGRAKKCEAKTPGITCDDDTPGITSDDDTDEGCRSKTRKPCSSKKRSKNNIRIGVIELRRMAVNPDYQRRYVAFKLVSSLEESLWQQYNHYQQQHLASPTASYCSDGEEGRGGDHHPHSGLHIYLTCSIVQQAAHKLYQRCGYEHTHTFQPKRLSPWLKWSGFQIYRFERTITNEQDVTTACTEPVVTLEE